MSERDEFLEIDLSSINNADQLHDLLARSLNFPDFYGRNWAAFWDSITGLVPMPKQLLLSGWQSFRERLPGESTQLQSCLDDMRRQYPNDAPSVDYR
jgi:RNAse (barnase) inhibitor barstar